MTSIFEQRRIEAGILKDVFAAIAARYGLDVAREILGEVTSRQARMAGAALAEEDAALNEEPSLPNFHRHLDRWKADGALEIEEIESTDQRLSFNITRCRYAETYEAMGVREIGDLLSCNRDGELICGYLPGAKFHRMQTIMKGASHCDFRFTLAQDKETDQ